MKLATQYPRNTAGRRCYTCASTVQGDIVLTGVFIDTEGALAVCSKCVGRMADLLGYAKPDKADELRASNRKLGAESARLQRIVDAAAEVEVALEAFHEARTAQ